MARRRPRSVRRTPGKEPYRPSTASRVLHGMIGTVIGGVVGYGVATSGLAPVPFQLVALYTGVLAAVCGGFGALAGRNLWRPRSRP